MTEDQTYYHHIEEELAQAKQTANYYFDAYRATSMYFSNQRRQMLHDQAMLRETQGQLRQVIRELHWYQAEFPSAQSKYHLETSSSKKGKGGTVNLAQQKPLPEIPHSPKTMPQAKKVKNTKGSKIRKALKPTELRRSLRLQGIDAISEEI
ncbi:hypothetical protein TWF718_001544 [Orbilia javanica]|uniref:Uncharacterized protein n=1 Tax=Orbilia javanica TaxID=47235 RepID=A0AAN8N5I5_9PEZI